ncbi:hypothetical protein K3495_g2931 [Podosphaera aphanis]|nr:hypothetical protein K3495_g2931 [Podosphaera aphanis]
MIPVNTSSKFNKNMSKNSSFVILGETDSFGQWDAALRARLAKRDLTGHDDPDVDPVERPSAPVRVKHVTDAS